MAAHGTIRGGYFPLAYDERLSASTTSGVELDLASIAKPAAYGFPEPSTGMLTERQPGVAKQVRLDFGVIDQHVGKVLQAITHYEPLNDIGHLLADRDLQHAILETHGDLLLREIRHGLTDIALGDVPAMDGVERSLGWLQSGSTVAALGFNALSAAMQQLGYFNTVVRIGPKWFAKGFQTWFHGPRGFAETVRWVEDVSPTMRAMGRNQFRDVRDFANADVGRIGGWVDAAFRAVTNDRVGIENLRNATFYLMTQSQRVVNISCWLGAFEKAMAEMPPDLAADVMRDRAVSLADRAVLDSQGGGTIKDLPSAMRGGQAKKVWTTFGSYMIGVLHNQLVEAKAKVDFRDPTTLAKFASDILLLWVLPSTLNQVAVDAVRGNLSLADEDDRKAYIKRLVLANLSSGMGSLWGVRELAGAVEGYAGYEGPAGSRGFAALGRFVKAAPRSVSKTWNEGEIDWSLLDLANEAAGILFHYPSTQIRRTVRGAAALWRGDTANPAAVVVGPPSKR